MKTKIAANTLVNFIEVAKQNSIDFARYTNHCGATKFVEKTRHLDETTYRMTDNYSYKKLFTQNCNPVNYPYHVLSIHQKSYLMYEVFNEITIWVCYTEENQRRQGCMLNLLTCLREKYPTKEITVDTFNESLRKMCANIGINIFQR